jgi:chromosome segregation ATPase
MPQEDGSLEKYLKEISEKMDVLVARLTYLQEEVSQLKNIQNEQREQTRLMVAALQSINDWQAKAEKRMERHEQLFAEIANILARHENQLEQHTEILREHTTLLAEIANILARHEDQLEQHTEILNRHTTLLSQILAELREHTVHYGDTVVLETDGGTMKAIIRMVA